ncbi:transcriptional regulator [Helicobacter sp. 13S00477-4]|uniref:transcriptional regulator n=1 Tax=Helicobacter sp. 13S00477-4 TaxID=1905759 RepID=UPI000BA5D37F|nr:transcriptional regulator [Helicobacter sp. 13S00477-4]PAF50835.1 hypothetical protein BKH44_06720 [Helicobacter sp. 13S00477-4]
MSNEQNLIKKTAKELGMTYKELGEAIGYTEGAIKNAIATDNVSSPMAYAIKMYYRIQELEDKLKASEVFKQNLKDFLDS